MTLSKQHIEIILKHPLKNSLDLSRARLREEADDDAQQKSLASLLITLVDTTAAFNLPSPDGRENVADKLVKVYKQVRGGLVKPQQLQSLVRRVVDDESSDLDIWEAVFQDIKTLDKLTPPPPESENQPPTFRGTPVKANSSRLIDSEICEIVAGALFGEIKNCTFRNVKGFYEKFFDSKSWREEQKVMLKGIMEAYDTVGKKWTDFPTATDEKPVWNWLCSLEARFLVNAPYKLYTTKTANQFKERKGQMDLFFQKPRTERTDGKFEYKDVLVVGEQKKSHDTSRFKADLLQLARYVRGVFADQPTRRFVHAFFFWNHTMELWVFDRSGPYSSGIFNIHDEPDKFARALVGYATMEDDAMGLDTFIEREGEYRHITLDDDKSGKRTRIELKKAIVRQRAIVCRGTTCYKTENNHVVKLSWASDKRKLEVEQLKLAQERGVKGVAELVAHHQITAIAKIREGLEFPKVHPFRGRKVYFPDPISAIASTKATASGEKRKSDNTSEHDPDSASGSKKPRLNSQKSSLTREPDNNQAQLPTGKSQPSLYAASKDLWDNRIYSCLVISPAGRVISDFETIRELLESMRDAIKAHQSLYVIGNILHRDISPNNIIITKPETADGFKGMLIDLDLAKMIDSGPSGARHQTGTMQFMAVEVLRRTDHTYRHDLESFFYVLLWMCAYESWAKPSFSFGEKPPQESFRRQWEIGSFKHIADAKVGHMTIGGLEIIMDEFPEAFDIVKPLCLKIRTILFGDTARVVIGTPVGDPDQLYRPIIAAYDEAIGEL